MNTVVSVLVACLAALLVFLLLTLCLWYWRLRRRRKAKEKSQDDVCCLDPPSTVRTQVLGDTPTVEIPPFSMKYAEEPPDGLKDSKTELFYPVSDYADMGLSSLKGTRDYQQDAADVRLYGEDKVRVVGILCDGMGGLEGGERASALAVEEMERQLAVPWEEYPGIFSDALSDVNAQIHGLKDAETGRRIQAGTTFTAVVMEGDELYYCSVGDSQIYLFRARRLVCLTTDHIYGNELDEMARCGRITWEQARKHEGRSALTSYIGISQLTRVDYNLLPERLRAGNIVMQCSDGLYRSLREPEMEYILSESLEDMQLAARRLTATAASRPGLHDNMTVLLIRYKGTERA